MPSPIQTLDGPEIFECMMSVKGIHRPGKSTVSDVSLVNKIRWVPGETIL